MCPQNLKVSNSVACTRDQRTQFECCIVQVVWPVFVWADCSNYSVSILRKRSSKIAPTVWLLSINGKFICSWFPTLNTEPHRISMGVRGCVHTRICTHRQHTQTLLSSQLGKLCPFWPGNAGQRMTLLLFVSTAPSAQRWGGGGLGKKWLLISFAWVLLIRTGSWEGDVLLCRGHSHNEAWHLMDYPDLFHKGCLIFSHRLPQPWARCVSPTKATPLSAFILSSHTHHTCLERAPPAH